MPKKNENYMKNPSKKLIEVLRACHWEAIKQGLWAKGQHRMLVDGMGIFLYRFRKGQWVRVQGLSFCDFKPQFLTEQYIQFTDNSKLNLAGG
jgi:hypothetical protein